MKTIRTLGGCCLLITGLLHGAVDDWPHWRGPNQDGVARGDAPTEFSATENVAWTAHVPGRGQSSPIVWGDKLFVTTAVPVGVVPEADEYLPAQKKEHQLMVLCFDRNTGELLWERSPKTVTPQDGYQGTYGSYASNTPATDGERLYAFWESLGIFVYDLDGNLIWQKDLPQIHKRGQFGEGTPTALYGDTLYLKMDSDADSFLIALDKNTGEEKWRITRNEPSSWTAPMLVERNGRRQLLTSGTWMRSYNPDNGELIWETPGLGLNAIPALVYADGIVYGMSGFQGQYLMAVNIDGEGNIADTDKIVWTYNRGIPYNPSPVLQDDILYIVNDTGMMSAFRASTGEPFYTQQRLPGPNSLKASLVAVNGKLYVSTEEGEVHIVRMGPEFEVIRTNSMGDDETFIATPAVVEGSLYLRGKNTLYCIRE